MELKCVKKKKVSKDKNFANAKKKCVIMCVKMCL